jgi:hypothetical protein
LSYSHMTLDMANMLVYLESDANIERERVHGSQATCLDNTLLLNN